MQDPIVGITHATDQVDTFYPAADLDRLRALAEVRILGPAKDPGFLERLSEISILTGSWGFPCLTPELLDAAPRLQAACYAAGSVKGFVTPEAYARGIVITTAMHANAVPVAEACVALITLANKGWFPAMDAIRRDKLTGWRLASQAGCRGNFGATVGLVGFGAIGQLVADGLRHMELEVLAYDPHLPDEVFTSHGATREDDLLALAHRSTVVSLHAPNINACAGMIGATFLRALPEGATLINTARGRVVDETALIAELQTGRINALLDVTHPQEPPAEDSPLYTLPNCWLSPHRAGSAGREVRRMGRFAIEECLRLIAGDGTRYRVTEDMLATMA